MMGLLIKRVKLKNLQKSQPIRFGKNKRDSLLGRERGLGTGLRKGERDLAVWREGGEGRQPATWTAAGVTANDPGTSQNSSAPPPTTGPGTNARGRMSHLAASPPQLAVLLGPPGVEAPVCAARGTHGFFH